MCFKVFFYLYFSIDIRMGKERLITEHIRSQEKKNQSMRDKQFYGVLLPISISCDERDKELVCYDDWKKDSD